MTDRELLESAAKAAGIELSYWCPTNNAFWSGAYWNPLADDGDALRLAVLLEIDLCFGANYVIADGVQEPTVNNANDKFLAVRFAIVRAAAEIGASSDEW